MEEKTRINFNEKENIVRSGLNYSPNKHLEPCSNKQRKTNKACRYHIDCLNEKWADGCWSSHALRDGKHYISIIDPNKIPKQRCYFMVTRHPDDKQYFSGVIFIKEVEEDEEGNQKGWVKGESVPFEPGVVEWKGHYTGEKRISNKETLSILKEYHSKVKDEKVKKIIDFYEEGVVPSLSSEKYFEITQVLQSKNQVIFYGPPGTGKTYKAREFAVEFLEENGGH